MGERRRIVPNNLAKAFGLTLTFLFTTGEVALGQGTTNYQAAPSHAGVTYLDQGWGHDTAVWWYHVSQGTVFMPYEWFISLEQASGDGLFAASDHLERLGFIADPASATNPRGLPVGFSIRRLDFPSKQPYQSWKGEWVGFACAACHTGQVRFHGQQIRLEGG